MEGSPSSVKSAVSFAEFGSLISDLRNLALILSFKDEIGKRDQSTRIFGITMSIQACLSPLGVVLCKAARAIERAGVLHQRNNSFRPHGIEFLLRQHARDEFARFAMPVFHGVNQRQRHFAFF